MYAVSLKQFDGPLDLLLSLIQEARIDIRDIFISEITEQYMASMALLDELDMDSASEFLAMAATLMEIKSRALLPAPPREENEDGESPEEALIRQLTEYRAFKALSQELRVLEENARSLYGKLPEEYPLPPPPIELTNLTLDALARAFRRVLARQAQKELPEPEQRRIRRDSFTVQGCMARILNRVRKGGVLFDALFEDAPGKDELITVFMALLELMKLQRVTAKQESQYGEIRIEAAVPSKMQDSI